MLYSGRAFQTTHAHQGGKNHTLTEPPPPPPCDPEAKEAPELERLEDGELDDEPVPEEPGQTTSVSMQATVP